jgi:hypothetical protein
MNLGILLQKDVRYASGATDKGIRVWLPYISNNDYWKNIDLAAEQVIVQLGLRRQTGFIAAWDAAVVITRDKQSGVCAYQRLPGRYTPVFYNEAISMAIYAEETLPVAQKTTPLSGSRSLAWVPSFAQNEQDALTKADFFMKKARLKN